MCASRWRPTRDRVIDSWFHELAKTIILSPARNTLSGCLRGQLIRGIRLYLQDAVVFQLD
jgi:hypothetical protein